MTERVKGSCLMKNIPFSVAMCVYGGDQPAFFQTAVNSILNQQLPPDEVVLVVDGPVPAELDAIISRYESMPVFHVIRLKENRGHGDARRMSLAHCKNDLVALMDADDIALPDRFAKQAAYFAQHPEVTVLGGQILEFINHTENVAGKRTVPQDDGEIKVYMKKRCPFNQMTVMFRKDAVEAAGGYIDWYCEEDYYLWLRLALAGAVFANLPDVLVQVRVGEDMYRRRGGRRYFASEAKLQKYMLKEKIISLPLYVSNVTKRFVVQVLLPNRLRGWVFRRFARE